MIPIRIRETVYPSAYAAAEALGLSVDTIWSALHRNTLDTVGTGRGKVKRDPTRNGRNQPITVLGQSWPSLTAFSRWLGYKRTYAANALEKRGKTVAMQDFAREVLKRREAAERKERIARLDIRP